MEFLRSEVRSTLADRPLADGTGEVAGTPLWSDDQPTAFFVEVVDVRHHRRLDILKSTLVLASGFRLRNALTAMDGFASLLATEADPERRLAFRQRIRGSSNGWVWTSIASSSWPLQVPMRRTLWHPCSCTSS